MTACAIQYVAVYNNTFYKSAINEMHGEFVMLPADVTVNMSACGI
jgi:hypothetical protein